MRPPTLTSAQIMALTLLQAYQGRWVEPVTTRKPYRELVGHGLAEGDGHGKFRATDDGLVHEMEET